MRLTASTKVVGAGFAVIVGGAFILATPAGVWSWEANPPPAVHRQTSFSEADLFHAPANAPMGTQALEPTVVATVGMFNMADLLHAPANAATGTQAREQVAGAGGLTMQVLFHASANAATGTQARERTVVASGGMLNMQDLFKAARTTSPGS